MDMIQVDDIIIAKPEITKEIEEKLQKGEYTVKGYKERFGDISYF